MPGADAHLAARPRLLDRPAVRTIARGLAALGAVTVYGVVGYVLLGWGPFDALYMVVITVSTVGYGEIHSTGSPWERVHTMLLIIVGTFSLAYTVGGFVQLLAEAEIRRYLGHQRMRRQIETLRGHVIIAGYGRMGKLIGEELAAAAVPFVVIERDAVRLEEIERIGLLGVTGDATDEDVLKAAGLAHARALVTAVPSDADSVFITLTARQMVPAVLIVARAEQPRTQKKLIQAGANRVVLPAAIGAHRIASILTNPMAVDFVELVTHRSSLAIAMDEVPVRPGGPLDGRTLRDADIGRRTGLIVVAVKRADGRVEFPPAGDEPFAVGDSIVLLGRRPNLDQFRDQFRA